MYENSGCQKNKRFFFFLARTFFLFSFIFIFNVLKISLFQKAIEEERFQDAAYMRDSAGTGLVSCIKDFLNHNVYVCLRCCRKCSFMFVCKM
jgi:hypothetical protein